MPRKLSNPASTTWLEISGKAILENLKQFQNIVPASTKIMPVVKSNAYGHGIVETAKILEKQPIWGLGVVNTEEALILRQKGISCPILALSYSNSRQKEVIRGKIDQVVYNLAFAKKISQTAKKVKKTASIHLKIDVGTSRLGILTNEVVGFIKKVKALPNIKLVGIFSHLADSENCDQGYTNFQSKHFNQVMALLEKNKINIPQKHLACSAATIVNKKTYYNLVRVGISIFGLWPSIDTRKLASALHPRLHLKPALTWKTKIIQIKTLPKDILVGYGCSFRTSKKTVVATIPVGYYEGFDRRLSNKGEVLISGQRCPVIGRICMNLTMVDITKLKQARVGDEVALIGQQGRGEITADALATKIGTINYEVIARINPLIPRVFV